MNAATKDKSKVKSVLFWTGMVVLVALAELILIYMGFTTYTP